MTTRAKLESEREALIRIIDDVYDPDGWRTDALTASIARVEALLSLSDEQCSYLVGHSEAIAVEDEADAQCFGGGSWMDGQLPYAQSASAHRTVANLIRREPRGDV